MNITTKYQTNANGTGQILAKGAGKQRTVAYNQERTPDWNHGNAAGVLANALGSPVRTHATLSTLSRQTVGTGLCHDQHNLYQRPRPRLRRLSSG
jgi:hypothetical protein